MVASGATRVPAVPGFAARLDAGIRQLHSDEYGNSGSVADGPVLAVGARTSGAELALELAVSHEVFLAGRPTAHVPDAVLRFAGGLYWAFINGVLTGRRRSGGGPQGPPPGVTEQTTQTCTGDSFRGQLSTVASTLPPKPWLCQSAPHLSSAPYATASACAGQRGPHDCLEAPSAQQVRTVTTIASAIAPGGSCSQ